MSTTKICTISGCISFVCIALQAEPSVFVIPYSRVIVLAVGIISGAIFSYFTKGRGDTGKS